MDRTDNDAVEALRAAREREAAQREILKVISRSRDDENPVFEVILDNARRLCKAPMGAIVLGRATDASQTLVAEYGTKQSTIDLYRSGGFPMDPEISFVARAIHERRTIHLQDMAESDLYRAGHRQLRSLVDDEGIRTILFVPLLAGDEAIGALTLFRHEVEPFGERDIELVETFATQAVIAIENVRQFRELQTRLEREKATREILEVISRSRDDDQPVFEAIIENARRLCEAKMAAFVMGEEGGGPQVMVANRGATEETLRIYREGRFPMDPAVSTAARAIVTRKTIHLHDMADTDAYRRGHPNFVSLVDQQGIRTNLLVPLISQGRGIGCLILFRDEVRPYSPDQIALVETFAAQAVIAIENVRQLKALVEARDDAEAALTDLKKAQVRLIHSEKMASLGQLTAGIAHEIKNPLNFVTNFARLSNEMVAELAEILEGPIAALDEAERDDAEDLMRTVRENLVKIDEHGRRADGIVKNMLLHSREGPSQRQTARVNAIAADALNLAYHGARAENPGFNIEMTTDLAEDVGEIECYPQDLMRVFLNVISNGMYAAYKRSLEEEGFAPEITVSSRRDGDRVEVAVQDNGRGIPAAVRARIFTPFFTTKPAGEGTGLGLSLSYDIVVKQHSGDLRVDSEPGQFTTFTVSLPQTLPADAPADR